MSFPVLSLFESLEVSNHGQLSNERKKKNKYGKNKKNTCTVLNMEIGSVHTRHQ